MTQPPSFWWSPAGWVLASALALGVGFLGEDVLPRHLVGLALILAGLLAMDGRLAKWRG